MRPQTLHRKYTSCPFRLLPIWHALCIHKCEKTYTGPFLGHNFFPTFFEANTLARRRSRILVWCIPVDISGYTYGNLADVFATTYGPENLGWHVTGVAIAAHGGLSQGSRFDQGERVYHGSLLPTMISVNLGCVNIVGCACLCTALSLHVQ